MTDREVIRRHSRSFSLAALLLPAESRRHAEALYSWCRSADDRIDQAADRSASERALDQLRNEVDDVYAGRPSSPQADALRRAVMACGIPREYPFELIAGFEMDVRGQRYETEQQLLVYCHRVAGVVGLMMCHALGLADDAGLPHAAHLGIAMQLTNIARDVAADWSLGRVYLPASWHSCPLVPGTTLEDEQVAPAVRRCLELAERYYQSGERGLIYLPPRCRLAIRTASGVYRAIGEVIASHGYRPSAGRAVVSRWRKATILMQAVLASLFEYGDRGSDRRPAVCWSFCPLP